jgi:hypothetical protein
MVTNLKEKSGIDSKLIVQGQGQNIWFKSVNKSLEHNDG